MDIKKGESIVFSAGTSEVTPRRLKQTFEAEVADRTPRDSFYHCLKNSAHQFHNQQDGEHYILAGYPWFKCRARDMFISLPGLTLALDEVDQFEDVMKTAEKAIRSFINDEPAGYKIYEMEHALGCLGFAAVCQRDIPRTMPPEIRRTAGGHHGIYPSAET